MNKKPFRTSYVEGQECVMPINGKVKEVRLNTVTREVFIVYGEESKYAPEDLDHLSWQKIKVMVLENGGEWSDRSTGVEYLLGVKR